MSVEDEAPLFIQPIVGLMSLVMSVIFFAIGINFSGLSSFLGVNSLIIAFLLVTGINLAHFYKGYFHTDSAQSDMSDTNLSYLNRNVFAREANSVGLWTMLIIGPSKSAKIFLHHYKRLKSQKEN